MTFLSPIPAIIAACICVPLLLLYYFLKLRRRPVKVSSTLLWERATKGHLQVNTPFRWLRLSLLLILQLLILAALLFAFARPAVNDPLGAASRVIILIDASASMSARDGVVPANPAADGQRSAITRLDQARYESRRIVDKLTNKGWFRGLFGSSQNETNICIVEFAHRARVRTAFTDDAATLVEAIDAVAPTDQPGNLSDALRLVAGLATAEPDEEGQSRPTTLFVVSDASFPDEQLPPAGVADVRLVPVGLAPPPPAPTPASPASRPSPTPAQSGNDVNLGITAISARRDLDAPSLVRIFARVQSNARAAISATVRLTLDGVATQAKVVTVPGSDEPRADAPPTPSIPAGAPRSESSPAQEVPVTFEFENTGGGLVVVSLDSSDLLASDDAAGLTLRPPAKAKALLIAPDGKPDEFLASALDGIDLPILTTAEPAYYEQLALGSPSIAGGPSSSPSVQDWDIVIFDRYKPDAVPPIPSISIGAGLPIPGLSVAPLLAPDNSTPGTTASARFATWRRTHTLMQSVNLDGVLIAPPMSLSLPTAPTLNTTVLAWGGNYDTGRSGDLVGGPLIALIESVGAGSAAPKRLVLAFEIAQTTWGIDFSFPIFMKNAVEFLTSKGGGLVAKSYLTSEPISLLAAPGVKQLTLRGGGDPRPRTIPVRTPAPDPHPDAANGPRPRNADVVLGVLDRAGIYEVDGAVSSTDEPSGNNGKNSLALAVNLCDSWESRIGVRSELDIPGAARRATSAEPDARREIWLWFIALALLLLTIEWMLFAKRMQV